MRAVFRADATPELGGGHVYRCLALAQALAADGWECRFAANAGAERVASWLAEGAFARVAPDALGREPADLLVVDHYRLGAEYERGCRGWAAGILALDDLADRVHDCDFLLDQNLGRSASDYAALAPERCRVMAGPAFALLREPFARARLAGWRLRGEVRRVLVSMGAADHGNATGVALASLAEMPSLEVDVVLGAAAPHLAAVREQARAFGSRCRVWVEIGGDAMVRLIAEADLAIAAAGGGAWERCCLGLPTLLVVLADNQRRAAASLAAAGAARLLGPHPGVAAAEITAAVREIAADAGGLRRMSRAAALVCDGLGARRVAGVVNPEHCDDGSAVSLRPATASDRDLVFAWQTMPETRRYFREPRPPSAAEHAAWFGDSLARADRMLNIIELDGKAAGVLRLDRLAAPCSAAGGDFSISILVDPALAGRGIAKAALRATRRLMAGQRLVADVMDDNVASRRAFEASGFRLQDGLYVSAGV